MSEREGTSEHLEDELVPFATAGDPAAGAYHCSSCGYGVTVSTRLPACPMCGGEAWEPAAWTPFLRATLS
jgi:rubrerythrin